MGLDKLFNSTCRNLGSVMRNLLTKPKLTGHHVCYVSVSILIVELVLQGLVHNYHIILYLGQICSWHLSCSMEMIYLCSMKFKLLKESDSQYETGPRIICSYCVTQISKNISKYAALLRKQPGFIVVHGLYQLVVGTKAFATLNPNSSRDFQFFQILCSCHFHFTKTSLFLHNTARSYSEPFLQSYFPFKQVIDKNQCTA